MTTASNVAEYTVSEVSFALKRTVEETFGHVRVRGEISGYRGPHSSGHAYFSLKDDKARIDAVVWRTAFQRLRFRPEEGLEVIATGKLTTFPGSSKYQIVIDALEPAGVGALMALLDERRKRLAAEGLFDAERKRPLPYLPRVIGVVTSPTGAVIRDILHRIADRFPVHVVVWPVRVQGDTSAAEVAAAIRGFNADGVIPRPDVLIVARGGGSLEDLWSFNDEEVVRAAATSAIPLISAVGHETDWTLLDHVADLRAPTPTGAAEMAVPVRSDLLASVDGCARRLDGAATRGLERLRTDLRAAARALPRPRDLLALPRQRLDTATLRLAQGLRTMIAAERLRLGRAETRLTPGCLDRVLRVSRERLAGVDARRSRALFIAVERRSDRFHAVAARLRPDPLIRRVAEARSRTADLATRAGRCAAALVGRRRDAFERLARVFDAVNYHAVLDRGFALVRDADGKPLKRTADIAPAMALEIEFADGRVSAVAAGDPDRAVRRPSRRAPSAGQGDLF